MSQLDSLLQALQRDIASTSFLWQALIVAASLGIGWLSSTAIGRRIKAAPPDAGIWKIGRGGLARIAFPVITLVCLVAGKNAYALNRSAELLAIAVSLTTAFALVRLVVYVLRHVFPPNEMLHAWEKVIAVSLWGWMALYITGLAEPIGRYLDHDLVLRMHGDRISALEILTGLLWGAVTLFVALWLGRVVESRLMAASHLDAGLRLAGTKLVRALFLALAVLIALPLAGIPLTALSVFGGALGVGLGFGLQKIASSYVSGFIMLLDRSIRPGDLVSVDKHQGMVTTLNARYTVIKALDGTEAIVPNDTLVTSVVVNHSYTDRKVLVKLPLQIAYTSPLEDALAIMEKAAATEVRILPEPVPRALVTAFGDNGINLELYCWISDPENGFGAPKSNIYRKIFADFQQRGIEIPYPQLEVRVQRHAAPQEVDSPASDNR